MPVWTHCERHRGNYEVAQLGGSIAPLVGYKYTTRFGFMFEVQDGIAVAGGTSWEAASRSAFGLVRDTAFVKRTAETNGGGMGFGPLISMSVGWPF